MRPQDARLIERAARAGLTLPAALRAALLDYFDLLLRWNATINLTSLSDPDEAMDRLLVEPVLAAALLPVNSRLMDLGSGGGSPAIPLALALGAPVLIMVESKGRKAAFLREAARAVGLNAIVEAERIEDLAASGRHDAGVDIVSARAIRMDRKVLAAGVRFLGAGGRLALFVSAGTAISLPETVQLASRSPLLPQSELLQVSHVPRGTSLA